MRRKEGKREGLIWYDTVGDSYFFGTREEFDRRNEDSGHQPLEIIYEIKSLSAKLAQKIVKELNAARAKDNESRKAA